MDVTGPRGSRMLLLVAACWLAAASGGCHRRGCLVRGSFELELRRTPYACSPSEICSDCPAGTDCAGCDPRELREPAARPVRRTIARLLPGRHAPPMVEQPYPGPSRFHPVPVRPVFSPREQFGIPSPESADIESAAESGNDGPPVAPLPEHLMSLPKEPAEVAGPPPPSRPRRLDAQAGEPSNRWVFRTPEPPKSFDPVVEARVQPTSRGGGGAVRR
jgi:hypothetical protein